MRQHPNRAIRPWFSFRPHLRRVERASSLLDFFATIGEAAHHVRLAGRFNAADELGALWGTRDIAQTDLWGLV